MKSNDDRGFQRFLDNVQYKSNGILRYERVFGDGFVSTGGIGMYLFFLFVFFSFWSSIDVVEHLFGSSCPC